jgi:hypothetical protein
MEAGFPGVVDAEIAWQLEALLPQELSAVTQTCVGDVPKLVLIEVVPCPDVIVPPPTNVQV